MFKKILHLVLASLISGSALADQAADMQKRLNEEVMSKSFSVESEANLNAYIEDALKRGQPPKAEPSKFWRNGYTCQSLIPFSWIDYRDCSYYHRYYGRYWPY
jgi:hypothetical protein